MIRGSRTIFKAFVSVLGQAVGGGTGKNWVYITTSGVGLNRLILANNFRSPIGGHRDRRA